MTVNGRSAEFFKTSVLYASKVSMVTFWSGSSDVAQGGITMRDSATAGLGDQPPAPPRTLEQIPLQELYRPVPEEVLPPITPPPVPADQPIEVDDEDMQPPDQPQQSMQPPLTPPRGGLHVPLPDSPMQDPIPGSPGPPQDPPPPSPPPAGVPVQAPGSPLIHWYVAPGTPPWMPQVSVSLWWPPVYPGPLPVAGGTFPSGGTTSSGVMPLTMTPSPVQPLQPMPTEPSPASPVVQTLDKD